MKAGRGLLAVFAGTLLIVPELSSQRPAKGTKVVRPATPRPGILRGPVAATTRIRTLPAVTYGAPIQASGKGAPTKLDRVARQTVTATVGGANASAQILHLNGRQGIDASGLPDGAKRLLAMHVRKLPLSASQYYLVDPRMAAEWAATHPVPPDVKPKETNEDDSDCGTVSINGIVDCTEDAAQAIAEEYERGRKQAQDWWDESTEKLARSFEEGADCFSDHTLPGPTTPVKFSITPSMTMSMQKEGSASEISGSLTLGVPLQADYQARMEFFYVPCLPFVFRPKRITADGSLTVGQQLAVDVTAAGAFKKTFTIPPSGGARIPLYVIPIMIGDVPVAVLDVSAYIEGEIDVEGAGAATGRFSVSSSHRSTFDFDCDGQGCRGQQKGTSAPTTESQSAQVEGQLAVQPGIFAGLQLSLNYNVLQGRAGVQPYLLGVANGCTAIAMQSGAPNAKPNSALTADLDWGVKLRAEALAGGERIGKRWEPTVVPERHIWFGDLASGGSSAFVATMAGPAQATAAQPSEIRVRMPTCYPYTSSVQYRVTWSGGGIPAMNAACTWQAGSGTCSADPAKDLRLSLTWQNAGAHTIAVRVVKDAHRTFSPAPPPAQLTITVATPED